MLSKVKNEFYRLVYIGHAMDGHLSCKIGQMGLGMMETGRVNRAYLETKENGVSWEPRFFSCNTNVGWVVAGHISVVRAYNRG